MPVIMKAIRNDYLIFRLPAIDEYYFNIIPTFLPYSAIEGLTTYLKLFKIKIIYNKFK